MERDYPQPKEVWRHFKENNKYEIVCIAGHTETGERLVIYHRLGDTHKVCARPLDMFMSEVDREKYPNAPQRYRFEKM